MSGADQEYRAALDVANERHVAACLAQGGFARIEKLPSGGVVHLGPFGLYRENPYGKPLPRPRPGNPVAAPVPDPVLANQRPLTLDRVMIDGVRYRPGRVLALQLLVHGGHDAVTIRSLAKAMGQAEGAIGTLVCAMVQDGLAERVGAFAGRPRTTLYGVTPEGRRLLARLTAIIDPDPSAPPVLDKREVTVLEMLGRGSGTVAKFGDAIGLGPAGVRKLLAGMAGRNLLKRYHHKAQHRWKASSQGREALDAARSGA